MSNPNNKTLNPEFFSYKQRHQKVQRVSQVVSSERVRESSSQRLRVPNCCLVTVESVDWDRCETIKKLCECYCLMFFVTCVEKVLTRVKLVTNAAARSSTPFNTISSRTRTRVQLSNQNETAFTLEQYPPLKTPSSLLIRYFDLQTVIHSILHFVLQFLFRYRSLKEATGSSVVRKSRLRLLPKLHI